jgi:hypothetical protein
MSINQISIYIWQYKKKGSNMDDHHHAVCLHMRQGKINLITCTKGPTCKQLGHTCAPVCCPQHKREGSGIKEVAQPQHIASNTLPFHFFPIHTSFFRTAQVHPRTTRTSTQKPTKNTPTSQATMVT